MLVNSAKFLVLALVTLEIVSSTLVLPLRSRREVELPNPFDEIFSYALQGDNNTFIKNLTHSKGFSFFVDMTFGNSNRQFTLMLDTGSSWTWIVDPGYKGKGYKNRYKCIQSDGCLKTNETKHLVYGKGEIWGNVAQGQMCIDDGACVHDQYFFLVNKEYDMGSLYGDGLLGLGHASLMDGHPTLIDTLYEQGVIKKKTFSLYFKSDFKNIGHGGELIIGGFHNHFQEKDFVFADVQGDLRWLVKMEKMRVEGGNSVIVQAKPINALVDCGCSLMILPTKQLLPMVNAIEQAMDIQDGFLEDSGLYYLPFCWDTSDFPNLMFTIGGKDFIVPPKAYVLKIEGVCVLLFQTLDLSEEFWIFGLPFMNSVYTYFDMDENKVGFAQLPEGHVLSSSASPAMSYLLMAIILSLIGVCHCNSRDHRDEDKKFLDEGGSTTHASNSAKSSVVAPSSETEMV